MDRYSQWLGIEAGARPPDHYALLGIRRFCDDPDLIDTVAHQRLDQLDKYSLAGSRESRDTCQEMMNEVARARVVLMNPQRRAEYNLQLGGQVVAESEQPDRDAEAPSREALDFYTDSVWAHLRKWRMDAHEERLLTAEAAALGINVQVALNIARRINSHAEHLARAKQMRTAFGAILAACVVFAGVVLFFVFPPYDSAKRPKLDEPLTGDTRAKPPAVSRRPPTPTTKPEDPRPRKIEDVEPAIVAATRPVAVAKIDISTPPAVDIPKPKPKPPTNIAATKPAAPSTAEGWSFDSIEAKRRQTETAAALGVKPEVTLLLGKSKSKMTFAFIPAGEFLMGSPQAEKDRHKNEVQHKVQITKPFYMAATEVTVAQWLAVTGSRHSRGPRRWSDLPVHEVKWKEAVGFCETLRKKTGLHIQLPSEAQWEYACRAGSAEAFCFGAYESELHLYATYKPKGAMSDVAQNEPNAFGLYDMHGNVYELCRDYYDKDFYSRSPHADPVNTRMPDKRGPPGIMRGGSCTSEVRLCRSAARSVFYRDKRSDAGLRVIFSLPDKVKPAFRMVKAAAPGR